jgi:hypothetical protein
MWYLVVLFSVAVVIAWGWLTAISVTLYRSVGTMQPAPTG